MNSRFAILVLGDRPDPCAPEEFLPRPGSRAQNYLELLSGFGMPFDVAHGSVFDAATLVRDDVVRYSSIILALPFREIPAPTLDGLVHAARDLGIPLMTDTFLLADSKLLEPFGLTRCRGLRFASRAITGVDGKILYRPKPYPHSFGRFDVGFRPLLRCLSQSWFRQQITLHENATAIATYGHNLPAIVSYNHGQATNYSLNFHPSFLLHDGSPMHEALRRILETNRNSRAVSFDLAHTACLRLDDPGCCERAHLNGFDDGCIAADEWRKLTLLLKNEAAHIDIAYVPQWVDDGDPHRSSLTNRGSAVENRVPGQHFNSWELVYSRPGRPGSHDYAAEYQAICHGLREGVFTILSHGFTHLTTNVPAWLRAGDKHANQRWYREFREEVTGEKPSKDLYVERMRQGAARIKEAFGVDADVLVPAAHAHTSETPEYARAAGFKLFSSDATYLLRPDGILVNRNVPAFYAVDLPWGVPASQAGYPFIFVFHDYDIYRRGVEWLADQIRVLRTSGIKRFLPLRELCFLLMGKIDAVTCGSRLEVTLDFTDSLLPDTRIWRHGIPIRVGAVIESMEINGSPFSGALTRDGVMTSFSLPYAHVERAGIVHLSIIMPDGQP